MFSYPTTIQPALKFVLALLQPIHSPPSKRPPAAPLIKLFAVLGKWVAASLSILAVDSAMHVAGAVAITVLLLVLLCNQLVFTLRILRNQGAGNAINCCAFVVFQWAFHLLFASTFESVLLLGLSCSILFLKVGFTIIMLLFLLFLS